MALFESYERRIDKINGVLAQYGLSLIHISSKNALVAQVLGTFLAPISSLAVVLNQILEQKGGAPAEAAEAPAEA